MICDLTEDLGVDWELKFLFWLEFQCSWNIVQSLEVDTSSTVFGMVCLQE